MLKIDLLPAYVREKQRVKAALVLFALILAGELAAVVGYYGKLGRDKAAIEKKVADILDEYNKANDLQSKIDAEKAKILPVQSLVDFYNQSTATAQQSIDVYLKIAQFTSVPAQLNNVQLTNNTATITGKITGEYALAQFFLNFMRCPAFSAVDIQADLQPFSFGGGGGGAPGGAPGGPGLPGGAPPGMPPGMAPGAGPPAAAPPGGPGGPGQVGGRVASVTAITLPSSEFTFTLTCTLEVPIGAPVPPGATQPTVTGGPGAEMPGMGPGTPGGPAAPGPGPEPPGPGGKAGGKGGKVEAESTGTPGGRLRSRGGGDES